MGSQTDGLYVNEPQIKTASWCVLSMMSPENMDNKCGKYNTEMHEKYNKM